MLGTFKVSKSDLRPELVVWIGDPRRMPSEAGVGVGANCPEAGGSGKGPRYYAGN